MTKRFTTNVIFAKGAFNEFGYKGRLPWGHCKEDMEHFMTVTSGSVVVMGRKTFESLPSYLKGRINIVLSGSPDVPCCAKDGTTPDRVWDGRELFEDRGIGAWLRHAACWYEKDVFVIGGVSLIDEAINDGVDCIYLTQFHSETELAADMYQSTSLKDYKVVDALDDYSKSCNLTVVFEKLIGK